MNGLVANRYPDRAFMGGGVDGKRGYAIVDGADGINPNSFALLTYAFLREQEASGPIGSIAVAQDTRDTGSALRAGVISAANKLGLKVYDFGVCPTPVTQWLSRELGVLSTAVVTASHNPKEYNGLKLMRGIRKPDEDHVMGLHNRYWAEHDNGLVIPINIEDLINGTSEKVEKYIDAVVNDMETEFGLQPLAGKSVVVDGANGAASKITPEVFRRLGADVIEINCDINGPINENCGAENLQGAAEYLESRPWIAERDGFIGVISNDGDADRFMGLGISKGKVVKITGNHTMYAMALRPKQLGMVVTNYSNGGFTSKAIEQGVAIEFVDNGDINVTRGLEKEWPGGKYQRGGEPSGHLIREWLTSGDGINAGAWLACLAANKNVTFGDLHDSLPMWPELMKKVKINGKEMGFLGSHPEMLQAIQEAEVEFAGLGRVIARPSTTESEVYRIWGESLEEDQLEPILSKLVSKAIKLAA